MLFSSPWSLRWCSFVGSIITTFVVENRKKINVYIHIRCKKNVVCKYVVIVMISGYIECLHYNRFHEKKLAIKYVNQYSLFSISVYWPYDVFRLIRVSFTCKWLLCGLLFINGHYIFIGHFRINFLGFFKDFCMILAIISLAKIRCKWKILLQEQI